MKSIIPGKKNKLQMQIKTKIRGKRVKGIVFARESGPSFGHFNIVIERYEFSSGS